MAWAKLQGAGLISAKLQGAGMIGANLQGADLNDANLQGADLSGANLRGADLSKANLQGTDLTKADMRATRLDNVKIWMTTWPGNIDPGPVKLGIRLVATLGKSEEVEVRKLFKPDPNSASRVFGVRVMAFPGEKEEIANSRVEVAARLQALLDSQQRRAWKDTEDFKRWQQRAGILDKEDRQLMLHRHSEARAKILCALPKKVRNNIINLPLVFFSSRYTVAYMWQLCLKSDKGPITGDTDRDAEIRRIFQQAAQKILPPDSAKP